MTNHEDLSDSGPSTGRFKLIVLIISALFVTFNGLGSLKDRLTRFWPSLRISLGMSMEMIMSVFLGVGLAAACGFRIFVPLFATSLFTHFGMDGASIGHGFEWISTLPAMLTFGVASLVEIFAYYIPFVDNLLDSISVPLAGVAGTLVSFSTMMDMDPLLQWSIALIAGGGLAGLIKGSAAGTRALSSATTAGLGNPVVSTAETGGSILLTVLAWFIPVLAIVLIVMLLFFVFRFLFRRRKAKIS